ncbi:sucrose-6-phosphate hydrolase [Vagococcus vulneris]|uniref:Sucrose-6-phosphate hydrolase n=1 Tax=Vagococcus vulneris TaxID=1977869 RepID=A0A429ZUH3_9ENTE|nr:sucrose-6-phosphate hydrolase [Vagococcus vulneris]RST97320.1 sucrose-6-phosphate hydrolase [Vagococcus vulneris]
MRLVTHWTTDLRYKKYDEWSKDYYYFLKQSVSNSEWRLSYHIQPLTGLLNDPNGFSFFNNRWHLFYQSYPYGPVHGIKSWHHLTSTDLVHWIDENEHLLPDSNYDSHGVYSGSAILVDQNLFIAYTGNVRNKEWERESYQLGALMNNDGQITKIRQPLITEAPNGYTSEFRDPQLIQCKDAYYIVIGAQNNQLQGKVLTYKSTDLKNWECLGELIFSDLPLGFMIECPNLVFIDEKPVLLFCPQGLDRNICSYDNIYPNSYVLAEDFDIRKNKLINVSAPVNLDEGFDVYATQAFNAPDGRVLSIGWFGLPEITYPTDKFGWAHCLTIVKELIIEDDKLIQRPVAEMKELRETCHPSSGELDSSATKLYQVDKNCYELELNFEEGAIGTLSLFANENLSKKIDIAFDTKNGKMTVNRKLAGESFATEYGTERMVTIDKGQLSLQIFVDESTVEVFINHGKKVVSSRVFPGSNQTNIFLQGNQKQFTGKLWKLNSIE